MTLRRLALIPALWLSLASTAPAPTPSALIECGVSHDAAMAALKAFPERIEEMDNGQRNHVYTMPPGMQVFGFPAKSFNALETLNEKRESMTIMAPIDADYDALVAAALKANGKRDCEARGTQPQSSCLVLSRQEGPWTVGLVIVQYRRESGISCGYLRPRG